MNKKLTTARIYSKKAGRSLPPSRDTTPCVQTLRRSLNAFPPHMFVLLLISYIIHTPKLQIHSESFRLPQITTKKSQLHPKNTRLYIQSSNSKSGPPGLQFADAGWFKKVYDHPCCPQPYGCVFKKVYAV